MQTTLVDAQSLSAWLLDEAEPGARYLALRDVFRLAADDARLLAARRAAHTAGPIAAILDAMHPDGFWVQPEPVYMPKYTGTVWAVIALAQLGARIEEDARIAAACEYLLAHSLCPGGQLSAGGSPSEAADCLQGNLCAALLDLGLPPPRLASAFEWMARTVTGEGLAPAKDRHAALRYYAGKCGPLFACGANNRLPCAWGAAKVMLAFGKLPQSERTPVIERAIAAGVEFLFSVDPVTAAYPCGWAAKPSGNWWKLGFPVFYITDLLQVMEALVALGHGQDARLSNALRWVESKRNAEGRWALEYDYNGKTWFEAGAKKAPNRWVTIRALRCLIQAQTLAPLPAP